MKVPLFTWVFLMPILTVLFGIDVVLVSGKCQNDQQSSLLRLKESLVFKESMSTKLVTWNSNKDCCEWAGISCEEGGLGPVTGLDLSNESISGIRENSTGLFSLQFLHRLNLSFNNFNTSPPAWFANLKDLIYLNLSNAGFVGQIPINISNMTSLVSLDLSTFYSPGDRSLKLENPNLATLVQNLRQLTVLRLDGVNISANGNEWCQALSSSLPNLQVLSLSNCFLSGAIHPSLAKLQSLSVIHLGSNNLSAPVPDFFANLSRLTVLRLSSCNLSGTIPANIFLVPTLEILDLTNNKLLQGTFPEISQNLSLQIMRLSSTNMSGTLPNSVANLTQLVYLDLSFNNFTGPIPSFRMSKNLNYIDLSHNQLSGEIPSAHWEGLLNLVYVDLRYNKFHGTIPSSLFAMPSLQQIQLSFNQFGGQVPEFSNASSSLLDTLDLSSNKLEGPIPMSFFNLTRLNVLLLSSNKFNGTIQLDVIQKLSNLSKLDLSYNNLTVNVNASNSALSSIPTIRTLNLASCNLRMFPDLSNLSKLYRLDLSYNQINGPIPRWISEVGNGLLAYLNLSCNQLVGFQGPFSPPNLIILDLHRNQLQGNIPRPPQSAIYVDYSSNNFASSIPPDIGNNLLFTLFFSLSNNIITGVIPPSICNASNLQVLDLSNNNLNGTIPACLIERSETLGVLNLRNNNFTGNIPDKFPSTCKLQTLDLGRNQLKGKVPESLANCTMLEVLDLRTNQISDVFPCLLKKVFSLRVLALRNNRFYGRVGCPQDHGTWPKLQIVNLASNNFNGALPEKCLNSWEAMMANGNETHGHLRFDPLRLTSGLYYQDSISVTIKGLEMELVKILTIFTSIDLSGNKFEGPIPEVVGRFNALYVLNLSHNALTGKIPSGLGKLSQLESLDLSANNLTGTIPQQLVKLTFLSVLNFSYNRLVGRIPTGNQFSTFSATSYEGNEGLCGFPLPKQCSDTHASTPTTAGKQYHRNEFDWQFIVPGLGFGLGAAAVVAPLMFCKKAHKWYDDGIDKFLLVFLPMLGLRYYTRNDWRIEPEDNLEEDKTDVDEEEEENEDDSEGRYCVYCTKLDIMRKRVIHDPRCTCYHSPPISSSSSSFSSSSS